MGHGGGPWHDQAGVCREPALSHLCQLELGCQRAGTSFLGWHVHFVLLGHGQEEQGG